ncbi:uncharacterized protein LY79DRAFT_545683 [Colletotrichum navitas]|uniref:Uncharacterized protein n=1 Tax=Colletotrichum navitas TaxID=681940 RepID=A0AAD8V974_9PEZI|nr:uncharacterized protein LY79DRAFT_545683 [Colletotrichum navitas]KAK1596195.1 hypothetical protein LY79DRAFT_545683 [Colletotrichum navitas]
MGGRAAITRSGRYSRVCVCVCVTAADEVPGFLVGLFAESSSSISRRGAHWRFVTSVLLWTSSTGVRIWTPGG